MKEKDTKYAGLSLPRELLDVIDERIMKKQKAYSSRTDFIKSAIRNEISRVEEERRKNEA